MSASQHGASEGQKAGWRLGQDASQYRFSSDRDEARPAYQPDIRGASAPAGYPDDGRCAKIGVMAAESTMPPARSETPPLHGSPGREPLAPRSLAYLNTRDGAITAFATAILAVATGFLPDPALRVILWAVLGVLAAVSLLVELPWLNRMQVRRTSYTVTPDFVYITRGWLWQRSIVIATPQVLNVEIVQGPLLRAFDVVSVRFTCLADIEGLGPLTREAAERVRTTVLRSQTDASDE